MHISLVSLRTLFSPLFIYSSVCLSAPLSVCLSAHTRLRLRQDSTQLNMKSDAALCCRGPRVNHVTAPRSHNVCREFRYCSNAEAFSHFFLIPLAPLPHHVLDVVFISMCSEHTVIDTVSYNVQLELWLDAKMCRNQNYLCPHSRSLSLFPNNRKQ